MWDGWEVDRGCLARVTAELRGFSRAFNKLSVRNWGTRRAPGPTLNLVASNSSCLGIAFKFSEACRADIVTYLEGREGKDFNLSEHPIALAGGSVATALVPMYRGPNVIPATTGKSEIVAMALRARGVSGCCPDYIAGIANQLSKLGIDDPAVTDLSAALNTALHAEARA
jgi:cation transport protein ChaC